MHLGYVNQRFGLVLFRERRLFDRNSTPRRVRRRSQARIAREP